MEIDLLTIGLYLLSCSHLPFNYSTYNFLKGWWEEEELTSRNHNTFRKYDCHPLPRFSILETKTKKLKLINFKEKQIHKPKSKISTFSNFYPNDNNFHYKKKHTKTNLASLTPILKKK